VRLVAVHRDARVEDIVLGEADPLGEAFEQLANFRVTLRAPYTLPFPNAILGENSHNPVLVVIVIANIAVFGFELLDRLDVLEDGDVFFEFRSSHVCKPPFESLVITAALLCAAVVYAFGPCVSCNCTRRSGREERRTQDRPYIVHGYYRNPYPCEAECHTVLGLSTTFHAADRLSCSVMLS